MLQIEDEFKVQNKMKKAILMLLPLSYLVIRFGFTRQLDQLGEFASYVLELVLVAVFAIFNSKSLLKMFHLSKMDLLFSSLGLISGFLIFCGAAFLKISIPFELKSHVTLFFLLIVAPILEESIFRFFLWLPIESFFKSSKWAWVATSWIFSYSHFHAFWFVPPEVHGFIQYQTIYTLFLGFACGYFLEKERSLAGAMLMHFAFNLGFFLASSFF